MLLYNPQNKENLTLDYFERGLVPIHLAYLIKIMNSCNEEISSILDQDVMIEGNGMTLTHNRNLPGIINVILYLSDYREIYRSRIEKKEKVYSSHVNIFNPELKYLLYWDIGIDKLIVTQTLRPFLQYKRMKLPLGKLKIINFKNI